MALAKRSSAGERVLEGRHVIGLFFLMLLFSGVFFTLGYVMGHNQLEGQVRAAGPHGSDSLLPSKPEPVPSPKAGKTNVSTPGNTDTTATDVPVSSDWEYYPTNKKDVAKDLAKPVPAAAGPSQPKAIAASAKANARSATGAPTVPKGSYVLQVAALRTDGDAMAIANDLRRKKFPAFVLSPQGDKYYRVQVGPYTDQKSVQAAKKGLEAAGFKAIIKH
jgi:cell division septation protein DedD